MKNKKNKIEEVSGDDWLATYADTITLLMTFFVLLYALSSPTGGNESNNVDSLSTAFNVIMKGETGNTVFEYMTNNEIPEINENNENNINNKYNEAKEKKQLYAQAKENEELEEITNINENLYEVIDEFININELNNDITLLETKQGVIMLLKDTVLFDTGSAELNNNSHSVLKKISILLNEINKNILVEGHTDNRPINTEKFSSNWELSTTRAVNVVKYLITNANVKPENLTAAGYGEYKPLVNNDSESNMAINRRVSILIKYKNLT